MSRPARRSFLMAAVCAAILTGCMSANGPQFSGLDAVPQGSSNIYVYRGSALFAAGQPFSLSMDDKSVGQLYNASYQKISTTPGKHVLQVAPGGLLSQNAKLEITAEPDKTYFYEYDFVTGPFANIFFAGASIQPRDQAKAMDDLKLLKRAD